jgi:Eco29kI restriction endonuclease
MTEAFNPLAMNNLAHSIVTRMLETDPTPLDAVPRFVGAGLYAIYYYGSFSAYSELLGRNSEGSDTEPIYVGKAAPPGGRRGVDVTTGGTPLWKRIREHASSVSAATNLDVRDFSVRWLVVEDIWIPLGESALIRRHRPVWNTVVDGFGNHDPGKGRLAGELSRWDTLHPGRTWAHKYQPRPEASSAIEQEIAEYLRSRLS